MVIIRRKEHSEFLLEMSINHPDLEVLGNYVNERTRIEIRCKKCGCKYHPLPSSLYMKHGCPKCGRAILKAQEEFESELNVVNSNINVLSEYKGNKVKISVSCKVCGYEWEATPNSLLRGKGCARCAGTKKRTQEEFIDEMVQKHPKIDVVEKYKNNTTKIECHCNICGNNFSRTPKSMLVYGYGCPICKKSKGELRIYNYPTNKSINFNTQHTFKDCKDIHVLPFDFYIPKLDTIIEYDGKQHFEVNEFFGGIDGFKATQLHDKIKTDYCTSNNIKIIRIAYYDFNKIEEILDRELINL